MIRKFKDLLPVVDETAYVDASAQVIGDVEIGAESSVWMNVVIRGDVNAIRIGRRTNFDRFNILLSRWSMSRRRGGSYGGRQHDARKGRELHTMSP